MAIAFPGQAVTHFGVPTAGALVSLWVWHRFGLFYAFPAALVSIAFLPRYWTSSYAGQHLILAALYAIGLAIVAAVRSRHRFDYLNEGYSLVEALLWLGIYLTINLQVLSLSIPLRELIGYWTVPQDRTAFYWTTWVLAWCLPVAMLARGIRQKDRFVIVVSAIAGILTLSTNTPYLGWQRHTWDPMVLGALLIGVALVTRRWLTSGPNGMRRGFTAERLSGKDREWMNTGSAALGVFSRDAVSPPSQASNPSIRFGGGDSGGGGATSDF
jgi:hypothetical protein